MSLLGHSQDAVYQNLMYPEFSGNPLIEALPKKLSQPELLDALKVYPQLPSDFRFSGDDMDREDYLHNIELLRQPLEIYFDVFRAIERAIKQGYSAKNPLSPTTQLFLHYPVDEPVSVLPKTGKFVSRGKGITLIGESGTGKTSMLEQILLHFPQVIRHHQYNGQQLGFMNQVVWIKVECPDKSSVRELCEEILSSLDEAVGNPLTKPASQHSDLMFQIEQRIKSSHLGMLVIDEMQNISFQRTRGESGLLKFLKKIVNRFGVPIVFCANPPFDETLVVKPQNARRSENGGAFYMRRLARDSVGWREFVSQLWQLQWTNVDTPLTETLERKLYELSVGNIDFACRTYAEAQRLVMGTDDETICEIVLQDAYERACVLSSRANDVLLARESMTMLAEQKVVIREENNVEVRPLQPFIPSVDRPQHPEFYEPLRQVLLSGTLREDILDPNIVRQAAQDQCPLDSLRARGLLCEDPLGAVLD